mgnify:CR=1 FL=1|jgi:hypothetical protein
MWQRHRNSNPVHVPLLKPGRSKRVGYTLDLFSGDDPVLQLAVPNAELKFTYTDPITITWSCKNGGCRLHAISTVLKDGRKLKISQKEKTLKYDQTVPIFEQNQEVRDFCVELDSLIVSFNVSRHTQMVLDQSLQQDVIECTVQKQQIWKNEKNTSTLQIYRSKPASAAKRNDHSATV